MNSEELLHSEILKDHDHFDQVAAQPKKGRFLLSTIELECIFKDVFGNYFVSENNLYLKIINFYSVS